MQFLGHLALGYFFGATVSKYTKEKLNIPLIWIFSLLPDIDILTRGFLLHRGPTHSILLAAILFLPLYLITKRGLPYFAALASHTLIGDYFNPSEKLFWPVSNDWFGAPSILQLTGRMLIIVEVSLFTLMVIAILAKYLRSS
jgi:membrane-bound metal-dependent hydrolase YbcI (DUF457 family)